MALSPGTKIGSYEIQAPLGEGPSTGSRIVRICLCR